MAEKDYTISFVRANIGTLLLCIPVGGLMVLLYIWIWGGKKFENAFGIVYNDVGLSLLFLLVLILGVLLHEFFHAVSWVMSGRKSWDTIKFGYSVKGMAPYVHCKEPIEVEAYRLGTAMPGIVLGVVPYLVALAFGSEWLALVGFIFTLSAGGDAIILWLIRNVEKGTLVEDHPHKVGCRTVNGSSEQA